MNVIRPRLALATLITGVLLIAIFAATVVLFRGDLQGDIHQKIFERDAAVLYMVAEAQLREAEANPNNQAFVPEMLVSSLVRAVTGMRGVVIYDAEGNVLQSSPTSLLQTELAPDDFARLLNGEHISRYEAEFPVDRYFADGRTGSGARRQAMLEILIPLHAARTGQVVGFIKYFVDAQPLAAELYAIDRRVNRQTIQTLALGSALIVLVLAGAYAGIGRAQRIIAERNERLTRANFELTLAAKTSALGAITSHLIHGLQGSVAGLRAVVADRAADGASAPPEWQSAADYTERMQSMIHETVALLGDTTTQTTYELSGAELAATIRDRNQAAATAKGVVLAVSESLRGAVDSHRGSLICLIATNLTQNAIEAADPGRHVAVTLAETSAALILTVRDEGHGVSDAMRGRLFEPGRSGKPGGTGLGLAISHLMARQIGATLELVESSASGTIFRLSVPIG